MSASTLFSIQNISRDLALQALDFGLITPEKFSEIKRRGTEVGKDIFSQLLKESDLDEILLLEKLFARYGRPYTLKFRRHAVTANFPKKYCLQNGLLPIVVEGSDALSIGISAPVSLNALKNFNLLADTRAAAYFIPFSDLKSGILALESAINDDDFLNEEKKVTPYQTDEVPQEVSIDKKDAKDDPEKIDTTDERRNQQPDHKPKEKEKAPRKESINFTGDVINGVNEIFERAIDHNISDIHLEQFRDEARIRFRRNGSLIVPSDLQNFVSKNFPAVISRIKIISGLDIAERRLPQDGAANIVSSKTKAEADIRVSIIPTSFGERAVLRILRKSQLSLDIHSLGFSDEQERIFKQSIEAPQGMVLVTGPTGSGKSTTLYGAINYLNKDDVNILTAEDPVEYTIAGIGQVQIRESIGLTFASALRSFLRQDPEIILVGEIRDQETADIATKASLTGHLVMSTLHTNSAIGAITRLINMGLPRYLVSNALSCVVAQRLMRMNCPHCLRNYTESEIQTIQDHPLVDRIDLKTLKKGQGCVQCNDIGFASRKAVHEVLEVNMGLKALIDQAATEGELFEFAKSKGFKPMIERGLEFVASGQTTLEELLRSVPLENI
jgi:type IV pilus assembly protein PilB